MSIYAITLTLAGMIGVVIRAGVLDAVGYNATAYAKGAPVPAAVATQIGNLMTLYPFIISLVVLVMFHFYPISDVKLREIKAALKARDKSADGE